MSELMAAIKNGLERGESLQATGQSLVNAGYSIEEVNEAIAEFDSSPNSLIKTSAKISTEKPIQTQKEIIPQKIEKEQVVSRAVPENLPVKLIPEPVAKTIQQKQVVSEENLDKSLSMNSMKPAIPGRALASTMPLLPLQQLPVIKPVESDSKSVNFIQNNSNLIVPALVIIASILLIVFALLGLYWDKIF